MRADGTYLCGKDAGGASMVKWILASLLFVTPIFACQYSAKIRAFDLAVEKYLADPTSVNADKICNIWTQIGIKFKGDPDKPQPPLPAGVMCTGGSSTGGGRSGYAGGIAVPGSGIGPGGVIGHIGSSHPLSFWIRNHSYDDCFFTYILVPDPGNPPGFTLTPSSGGMTVMGRETKAVDFDLTLDPTLADCAIGTFRLEVIDTCTGLPLPDDTAEFQVKASADCSVVPNAPFILSTPGSNNQASWTITNYRADISLMKPFSFVGLGDPASLVGLNDGSPYFVPNMFPADKSVTGGIATVPPLDSIEITWDDLRPGEFCDPQMIGCCGLLIDDIPVVSNVFNDMTNPDVVAIELVQLDLVGAQPLGPFVSVEVPPFVFQAPTLDLMANPRPIPEVIDQLALQILQQSFNQNGFDVSVMVFDQAMTVFMLPNQFPAYQSLDPSLQWNVRQAPIPPFLPEWPIFEDVGSLTRVINGWRYP